MKLPKNDHSEKDSSRITSSHGSLFQLRRHVVAVLFCLTVTALYSQTTDVSSSPTFQSKVREVLLDVVVTDRNDKPVSDLTKDDFQIFEEGKPQTIASFEEHKGLLPEVSGPSASLPPNYYSNYPQVTQSDALNVLVLDALNTPLEDQASVHKQMVDYLKKIQPGRRLAIFTLSSQLRLVEGFSADPKMLLAALNNKKWGGGTQSSPVLRTDAEDDVDQNLLNQLASSPISAQLQASIDLMKQFQAETKNYQTYSRVQMTVSSLQQLAGYLSGFPGRKNVIWFSGSFPISILPTPSQNYDFNISDPNKDILRQTTTPYENELRRTTNMLAAAQIAIYPITASGLNSDPFMQANHLYTPDLSNTPVGQTPNPGQIVTEDENTNLQNEHADRNANQTTMDEVAKATGGEAFYNTNGLSEALARVLNNGTHYYAISYSPTDRKLDGGYRPITVKLRNSHYKLAYRRGYFADRPKEVKGAESHANHDPLQPMMERGLPDSTEILYKIRVLRAAHQPDGKLAEAGDNTKLKGPATRYAVDFAITPDDLDLELTPDGVRHGDVEVALVTYDHGGNPLNWTLREMKLTIEPKLYAVFEQGGVQLHQEIDVPAGDNYLRTGIYDLGINKAGTLEIPLNGINASEPPAPAMAVIPAKTENSPQAPNTKVDNTVSPASSATMAAVEPVPSIPPAAATSSAPNPAKPVQPMSDADLTKKIESYCKIAASTSQHPDALEGACVYALSLRMKLPRIICSQDTERHWWEPLIEGAGDYVNYGEAHRDHVTAQVEYRNRQEIYSDVRINGQLVKDNEAQSVGAASSDGEFAMILQNIFIPSSKAEFHFIREDKVHSADALVFQFDIQQSNNHYYFLQVIDRDAKNKIWYPAYHGQVWLDKNTFDILRLERDTEEMPKKPIKSVKTTTDYKDVVLGDGTSFVLPTASNVETCLEAGKDKCSYNMITFINWHKFTAKTEILMNSSQ